VTYADGNVEEIEADELRDTGSPSLLTFVNYRVLFVTTIYTEIVRRLDRCSITAVDKAIHAPRCVKRSPLPGRMVSAEQRTAAAIDLPWRAGAWICSPSIRRHKRHGVIEIDAGFAHTLAVADPTLPRSAKRPLHVRS
jgi:hypothetical protein